MHKNELHEDPVLTDCTTLPKCERSFLEMLHPGPLDRAERRSGLHLGGDDQASGDRNREDRLCQLFWQRQMEGES